MMLTSATGNNRASQAGFTLAEVLITLAVVGLAAGAIVLAIPGPEHQLRQEAEAFVSHVRAARDMAIITNSDIVGQVDIDGYRFSQGDVDGGRWDEDTTVLIEPAGRATLRLGALGGISPTSITLRRGEAAFTVSIAFDGSVEMTADG